MYHAIDDASRSTRGKLNHLKWINLWSLMQEFTDPAVHEVMSVKLFTAYPTWNQAKTRRHREFVKAQESVGVDVIVGQFKQKYPRCKICGGTYKAREEKESDVNIATHLIADAYSDVFDQAFLVTNDSDLLGPVRMMRERFPKKRLKIIAPPFRHHSKALWATATHRTQVLEMHLEQCLLPQTGPNPDGKPAFVRPSEYDPPK